MNTMSEQQEHYSNYEPAYRDALLNGFVRNPETATDIHTGVIRGVTEEWNTEALDVWEEGYWERWLAEGFIDT